MSDSADTNMLNESARSSVMMDNSFVNDMQDYSDNQMRQSVMYPNLFSSFRDKQQNDPNRSIIEADSRDISMMYDKAEKSSSSDDDDRHRANSGSNFNFDSLMQEKEQRDTIIRKSVLVEV